MLSYKMTMVGNKHLFPGWLFTCINLCSSSEIGSVVQQGLLESKVQEVWWKLNSEFLRRYYCSLIMLWNIACWYFVVFRNWEPALLGVLQTQSLCGWEVADTTWSDWTWLLNHWLYIYTLGITVSLSSCRFPRKYCTFYGLFFFNWMLEKCFHKTNAGEKNHIEVGCMSNIAFH